MSGKTSSRKFPTVWGKFEKVINGKLKQFWIEDLPENNFDLALDYFCKDFLRDEPICRCLELTEDEDVVKITREFLLKALEQKCTLACYTKNENGENELVALNCCIIKSATDEDKESENEKWKKLIGTMEFLDKIRNPFQELYIDTYLGSFGLLTLPEYRGHNIGLEVLNCRKLLLKALGLKASFTMFSSPASQRLAEKAGFKEFATVSFEEMAEKEPFLKIPNIELYTKIFRHMYILNE